MARQKKPKYEYVEQRGGDLFNKKYTTRVTLSPVTGGIVRVEAEEPK